MSQHSHRAVTAGGLLITLGIIYGDIGTSPLYVFKAIVGDHPLSKELVFGGVSCIFWTLTLQTTFKYVFLTLKADNHGEGGIFSLYALVRRTKRKWLILPAIIGGAALLADGIITPPISVASAVEGLRVFDAQIPTVPIVISIITALFFLQQFGTKFVGRFFGPVMLFWFLMLGILGSAALIRHPYVLAALNPYYAIHLITAFPKGFWILSAVFLCTTGAEALYSDLGHCGRKNIRITWGFVKAMLLLNYLGQSAWLMEREGQVLTETNPFYAIMPSWWLIPGIVIATAAAIVASQALISGSFTLINEAMRLNFWPKVKVVYPTELRGQLYIPSINWLLLGGYIGIVLFFRESSGMEAAYGLAIVITMLSTTLLLGYYLYLRRFSLFTIGLLLALFLSVEISFLIANLEKFPHGGWLTLLIASLIILLMWSWYKARKIRNRFVAFEQLEPYFPVIRELSRDLTVPKYATHLVYMTTANDPKEIESKVIYSMFQKQPKRADLYWLIHVDVMDEPYKLEYKVTELMKGIVFRVDLRLGFRVAPRVNLMFRKVVEELVKNHEVDITSRYESLGRLNLIGDFRFIVMEKFLSYENELSPIDKLVMGFYFLLKKISLSEERAFGLDTSSVTVEKFPLIVQPARDLVLKRVEQ